MSTKVLSVLAVFLLIFAFSGCTGNDEETATVSDSSGINVEFMPGAPPQQISEDDTSFDIGIKLDNRGEYDLSAAEGTDGSISVFLLGVNPMTIGLCEAGEECSTELIYDQGLGGAHYVNSELIPGEIAYVNWQAVDGSFPSYDLSISSDQTLNFVAQACYGYKTMTTAEGCFSDNAYAQATGAETCTISGEKDASNTIAPIQITNVVENPAGKNKETSENKYAFTFTIENIGDGIAFPITKSVSNCTKLGVADLNSNQITIDSVKVGGVEKVECLRKGAKPTITLVDNKGSYTCTFSQPSISGDYSELVEITLSYNYYTQTTKQVVVKNSIDF
ncbi:hypothetical protein HN510_05355 [Candidatus Woesearchaeota archaeon]|nr:hypothetical protein [Candidatus Woesearchaeota archaeon]